VTLRRASALACAALIAGGFLVTACGPKHNASAKPSASPVRVLGSLPSCTPGDAPEKLLAPDKLAGPAAGSVRDGRVTRGWSLDGGALAVTPASASEQPVLTERQAACNLLASLTPTGGDLSEVAPSGSVLGYGRISVAAKMLHSNYGIGQGQSAALPAAFEDRPAWILAVKDVPVYSCPMMVPTSPSPSSSRTRALPPNWFYKVFAIDATTGRDAISYVETTYGGCRPGDAFAARSSVVYERMSLPWRGLSGAGASLGSVQAAAAPCEVIRFGGAWVNDSKPQVEVMALRQLAQTCTSAKWKTIVLHPATVIQSIPQRLSHAPVGPIDRVDH